MLLTKARTRSPELNGRSSTIGVASSDTTSRAGATVLRSRPGSPWMPMPISISDGPSSKVGLPAAGTVHEVSAMPMLRALALTLRHSSATSASDRPCSAAAPQIFSASTVAPTPRGVQAVLDGHVVVDDYRLDLDAVLAGQVRRHLEVQDVAGVVLHDVQHAGAAVDRLGGGLHLVRGGRGEHLAGAGRVQHARADEAAVHGLVP